MLVISRDENYSIIERLIFQFPLIIISFSIRIDRYPSSSTFFISFIFIDVSSSSIHCEKKERIRRERNEALKILGSRLGLVPKRPREMAAEHDEAGGQHDDEQRGVSRHTGALEHGRLAERGAGSQHPGGQQQHAVDLDGGAPRSSSPTFRRFLSGLLLRSLLTTA